MNCAEFEQLVDSYLDGDLSGSLRLEFDAHRLRCRRCQLTMVLMESVGNVVASDRAAPELPDDFTERVMGAIEQRRPLSVRLRPTRVAIVVGAMLQAAAVILLAIWLPSQRADAPTDAVYVAGEPRALTSHDAGLNWRSAKEEVDQHERLFDEIYTRVAAAGVTGMSDLKQCAHYASALSTVPDEDADAFGEVVGVNPLGIFLEALLPGEAPEPESSASAADEYSL